MRKSIYDLVDYVIWSEGVKLFKNPSSRFSNQTKFPHELDFLRGLHSNQTLSILKNLIECRVKGSKVSISSIWQDKLMYVKTKGTNGDTQEIADLAIIVKVKTPNLGTFRRMWMLQAKKMDNLNRSLYGPSSRKEIHLYEHLPSFQIADDHSGRQFNLSSQFGYRRDDYKHWSFLFFKKDHSSTYKNGGKVCRSFWPASNKISRRDFSFSKTIVNMCKNPKSKMLAGAEITTSTTNDWNDLYEIFIRFAKQLVRSKFPNGRIVKSSSVSLITSYSLTTSKIKRFNSFTKPYFDKMKPSYISNLRIENHQNDFFLNEEEFFDGFLSDENGIKRRQNIDDDDGFGGPMNMLFINVQLSN